MADREIQFIRSQMDIRIGKGEISRKAVPVWLPFPNAAFGVQKSLSDPSIWLIVHVATTRLAPWPAPEFRTRREALGAAKNLSLGCPSADRISLDERGNVVGPLNTLAAEFRAHFDETRDG